MKDIDDDYPSRTLLQPVVVTPNWPRCAPNSRGAEGKCHDVVGDASIDVPFMSKGEATEHPHDACERADWKTTTATVLSVRLDQLLFFPKPVAV